MRRPLLCELHAHTTWSDGALSIHELVDLYGRCGFDVLAITDHVVRGAEPLDFDAYLTEIDAEAGASSSAPASRASSIVSGVRTGGTSSSKFAGKAAGSLNSNAIGTTENAAGGRAARPCGADAISPAPPP